MPKRNAWGNKYPIEFLKYLMNEKKYWDAENVCFKCIEGMNLLATACSNQYEPTTPQFYSKFNIVTMPEMMENEMN